MGTYSPEEWERLTQHSRLGQDERYFTGDENESLWGDAWTAVKHTGLDLARTAAGTVDLATGGAATELVGGTLDRWEEGLNREYSADTQIAQMNRQRAIDSADGEVGKGLTAIGETISNPRLLLTDGLRMAGQTVAPILPARAIGLYAGAKAATRVASAAKAGGVADAIASKQALEAGLEARAKWAGRAAVLGEGGMGAGAAANQVVSENLAEGRDPTTGLWSAPAVGAATSIIAGGAGKLSKGANLESILAGGKRNARKAFGLDNPVKAKTNAPQSLLGRTWQGTKDVMKSFASEGAEEAAQGVFETALPNYALDKPITEGMGENVGQSALMGGLMGGGMHMATLPFRRDMRDSLSPEKKTEVNMAATNTPMYGTSVPNPNPPTGGAGTPPAGTAGTGVAGATGVTGGVTTPTATPTGTPTSTVGSTPSGQQNIQPPTSAQSTQPQEDLNTEEGVLDAMKATREAYKVAKTPEEKEALTAHYDELGKRLEAVRANTKEAPSPYADDDMSVEAITYRSQKRAKQKRLTDQREKHEKADAPFRAKAAEDRRKAESSAENARIAKEKEEKAQALSTSRASVDKAFPRSTAPDKYRGMDGRKVDNATRDAYVAVSHPEKDKYASAMDEANEREGVLKGRRPLSSPKLVSATTGTLTAKDKNGKTVDPKVELENRANETFASKDPETAKQARMYRRAYERVDNPNATEQEIDAKVDSWEKAKKAEREKNAPPKGAQPSNKGKSKKALEAERAAENRRQVDEASNSFPRSTRPTETGNTKGRSLSADAAKRFNEVTFPEKGRVASAWDEASEVMVGKKTGKSVFHTTPIVVDKAINSMKDAKSVEEIAEKTDKQALEYLQAKDGTKDASEKRRQAPAIKYVAERLANPNASEKEISDRVNAWVEANKLVEADAPREQFKKDYGFTKSPSEEAFQNWKKAESAVGKEPANLILRSVQGITKSPGDAASLEESKNVKKMLPIATSLAEMFAERGKEGTPDELHNFAKHLTTPELEKLEALGLDLKWADDLAYAFSNKGEGITFQDEYEEERFDAMKEEKWDKEEQGSAPPTITELFDDPNDLHEADPVEVTNDNNKKYELSWKEKLLVDLAAKKGAVEDIAEALTNLSPIEVAQLRAKGREAMLTALEVKLDIPGLEEAEEDNDALVYRADEIYDIRENNGNGVITSGVDVASSKTLNMRRREFIYRLIYNYMGDALKKLGYPIETKAVAKLGADGQTITKQGERAGERTPVGDRVWVLPENFKRTLDKDGKTAEFMSMLQEKFPAIILEVATQVRRSADRVEQPAAWHRNVQELLADMLYAVADAFMRNQIEVPRSRFFAFFRRAYELANNPNFEAAKKDTLAYLAKFATGRDCAIYLRSGRKLVGPVKTAMEMTERGLKGMFSIAERAFYNGATEAAAKERVAEEAKLSDSEFFGKHGKLSDKAKEMYATFYRNFVKREFGATGKRLTAPGEADRELSAFLTKVITQELYNSLISGSTKWHWFKQVKFSVGDLLVSKDADTATDYEQIIPSPLDHVPGMKAFFDHFIAGEDVNNQEQYRELRARALDRSRIREQQQKYDALISAIETAETEEEKLALRNQLEELRESGKRLMSIPDHIDYLAAMQTRIRHNVAMTFSIDNGDFLHGLYREGLRQIMSAPTETKGRREMMIQSFDRSIRRAVNAGRGYPEGMKAKILAKLDGSLAHVRAALQLEEMAWPSPLTHSTAIGAEKKTAGAPLVSEDGSLSGWRDLAGETEKKIRLTRPLSERDKDAWEHSQKANTSWRESMASRRAFLDAHFPNLSKQHPEIEATEFGTGVSDMQIAAIENSPFEGKDQVMSALDEAVHERGKNLGAPVYEHVADLVTETAALIKSSGTLDIAVATLRADAAILSTQSNSKWVSQAYAWTLAYAAERLANPKASVAEVRAKADAQSRINVQSTKTELAPQQRQDVLSEVNKPFEKTTSHALNNYEKSDSDPRLVDSAVFIAGEDGGIAIPAQVAMDVLIENDFNPACLEGIMSKGAAVAFARMCKTAHDNGWGLPSGLYLKDGSRTTENGNKPSYFQKSGGTVKGVTLKRDANGNRTQVELNGEQGIISVRARTISDMSIENQAALAKNGETAKVANHVEGRGLHEFIHAKSSEGGAALRESLAKSMTQKVLEKIKELANTEGPYQAAARHALKAGERAANRALQRGYNTEQADVVARAAIAEELLASLLPLHMFNTNSIRETLSESGFGEINTYLRGVKNDVLQPSFVRSSSTSSRSRQEERRGQGEGLEEGTRYIDEVGLRDGVNQYQHSNERRAGSGRRDGSVAQGTTSQGEAQNVSSGALQTSNRERGDSISGHGAGALSTIHAGSTEGGGSGHSGQGASASSARGQTGSEHLRSGNRESVLSTEGNRGSANERAAESRLSAAARDRILSRVPQRFKPLAHTILDSLSDGAFRFMFSRNFVDEFKKILPSISKWWSGVEKLMQTRAQWQQKAADIADRFTKLNKHEQAAVNKVAIASTLNDFWPERDETIFTTQEAWDAYVDGIMSSDSAEDYKLFLKQYQSLSEEGRKILRDVLNVGTEEKRELTRIKIKDAHETILRQMRGATPQRKQELEDQLTREVNEINRDLQRAIRHPYVPLGRKGTHVVAYRSKEYLNTEKAIKDFQEKLRNANRAPTKAEEATLQDLKDRLDAMASDSKHYIVEFFEDRYDANKRYEDLKLQYPNLEKESIQVFDRAIFLGEQAPEWATSRKLLEQLTKEKEAENGTGSLREQDINRMADLLQELFVKALPDVSARKMQLRRRGVSGYNENAMENFIQHANASSHLIASLTHSQEIHDALQAMGDEAKQQATAGRRDEASIIANEVRRRQNQIFSGKAEGKTVGKIKRATSVWMLLTNPAFYLQNILQPGMMSAPYINGALGVNCLGELTNVMKRVAQFVTKDKSLQSLCATLSKNEREAIMRARDHQLLTIGITTDLGTVSNDSAYGRATNWLTQKAQTVEVVNRVSTHLVAYRNAIKKGMTHEEAMDFAEKVIVQTHGDYSKENAPSIMNENMFTQMASQFRKFQFIQTGMVYRMLRDSARKDLSPAERAIARRQLMWIMATHFAAAGLKGTPVLAQIAALSAFIFGGAGDDDEDLIREAVGDKDVADFLLKGMPMLIGFDLSKKVGAGDMLNPLPFFEYDARKGKRNMGELMANAAGPWASVPAKMMEGVTYLANGEYSKGIEQILPYGLVSNLMKATRLQTEGYTNRTGDVLIQPENMAWVDWIYTGMGLTPTQMSRRTYLQGWALRHDAAFSEMKSDIQRNYDDAKRNHDYKGMAAAKKKLGELNRERIAAGYTPIKSTQLESTNKQKLKREKNAVGGVVTTNQNRVGLTRRSEW